MPKLQLEGQKFGRLLVLHEDGKDNKNGLIMWKCLCDCGNLKTIRGRYLKNGHVKSCGCFHDESARDRQRCHLENRKFGLLTVIKHYTIDNKRNYIWECKCDCGNTTYVSSCNLNNGHTSSCGNCGIYRNNIRTSIQAIKLHNMIGRGIHNYKSRCGRAVDIAFSISGKKIAIEYDEWYWHGYRIESDKIRIKQLLEDGWAVILIQARRNFPNLNQINDCITNIINGSNLEILVLEGWGEGKFFTK